MAKRKDFTCEECGQKFDSMQALGGHAQIHRKKQDGLPMAGDEENKSPPSATLAERDSTEEGELDQARRYRDDGYSAGQLIEELRFNKSTVRKVYAERLSPEAKPEAEQEKVRNGLPVLYEKSKILSSEALLRRYTDGSYEDELELRGMMKLRAAILLAGELAEIQKTHAESDALRVKPILELMKETRIEQDAAAARAKESSKEIADRAAYEGARMLAEQMMPEVRALKSQAVAGSAPDPVTRMMNALQAIPRMMQMSQQLMATMGMTIPGTSPPLQPQPSQGTQSPGWPTQQPAGLGFQPATKDEIEEAFGDE